MITVENKSERRNNKLVKIDSNLVITGGGLSGTCAAITAARAGIIVTLVQDRPVLGGNASSEVRLWILGATSHMGNNNRWSREGGVIDEILIENLYRNKEGNPLILDTILLEKVRDEPNITLLLNTVVFDVEKKNERNIKYIKAFCSQNSTEYELHASLFCDASGDGIVSFLSGASFRMGAETKEEFGEMLAPDKDYGGLLGHSIYFYSKKVDYPVKFIPPSFALNNVEELPRYHTFNLKEDGCRLWWLEYGGRMDTVHDTEHIKWELWKVVYGIWNHIKNSGKFEDAEYLTLEWVGTIPGKRESRRFEGDYMLRQQDVVNQTKFDDAVAHGGWALDLHPADGVYSELNGAHQWHSKGVYQIPYRSYVSKDIDNLFYAGRIISATHVAFGSSRVMATCALGAQAVGMAAALSIKNNLLPRDLTEGEWILKLQNELNRNGQSIPGIPIKEEGNLIKDATINASSTCVLHEIPFNGSWTALTEGAGQLLPLEKDIQYTFKVEVKSTQKTSLKVDLRISSKKFNYTPDMILETIEIPIELGEQFIDIAFSKIIPDKQYGFLIFHSNDSVSIRKSENRYSGIVSVFNGKNKAVSNNGYQTVPKGSGLEEFEFWCPRRRPKGQNIAMEIIPALNAFDSNNLKNGFVRPYLGTNAWSAALDESNPSIELQWQNKQEIREITLFFDTDYDHPLESTLKGHPEDVIPFCVRNYKILDDQDNVVYEKTGNYQTINKIKLSQPIITSKLVIECERTSEQIPVSIFQIIVE